MLFLKRDKPAAHDEKVGQAKTEPLATIKVRIFRAATQTWEEIN